MKIKVTNGKNKSFFPFGNEMQQFCVRCHRYKVLEQKVFRNRKRNKKTFVEL